MPGVGVVDGGSDGGGDGGPEDRVHGGGQGQGPGICGVVVEVSVQTVAPHLGDYKYERDECQKHTRGFLLGRWFWLVILKLSEDKVLTVIA